MIDIHSHILPGLDDGAKNMDETLSIARQLYKSGFRTLIATPHVLEDNYLSLEDILSATELVRQRVVEAGIELEILPGAENYIFPDMAKWAGDGKLMTLGNTGKYILVELPMLEIPRYTDQVFFELQVKGLTVVLAHPERNKGLGEEPERLVEWAGRGVLFQLDLRSMAGRYGPQSRHLAEIMLQSNLIHFVGSDAHRVSRNELTYRDALQSVRRFVSGGPFQELTLLNPQKVLSGEDIQCSGEYSLNESVVKMRKQTFWNWLKAAFYRGHVER